MSHLLSFRHLSLQGYAHLGMIPYNITRPAAPDGELRSLPLGPVSTSVIDMGKLLTICDALQFTSLSHMFRAIAGSAEEFAKVFIFKQLEPLTPAQLASFRVALADPRIIWTKRSQCLTDLVQVGVLAEFKKLSHKQDLYRFIKSGIPISLCTVFPVLKSNLTSVRGVVNPSINELIRRPFFADCGLPRLHPALASLRRFSYLKLYDGVSMFYQYPLSPDVAKLFTTVVQESSHISMFTHTRLPMGFCYAVHLSQGGLTVVCELAWHLMGNQKVLVAYYIWVDNILLVGESKEALEMYSKYFELVAKAINMVVRAESEIDTSGVWAGLKLDLKAKDYALSEKFLTKAAELRDIVKAQTVIPLNLYQKYMGCVAYAAYVLRFPFAYLHGYLRLPVVDVMVRKVKTPMVSLEGVSHAVAEPLFNKQVKIPLVPPAIAFKEASSGEYILFTDASTEALGAVLVKGTEVPQHISRRWSQSFLGLHINVLEAWAIFEAILHWPELRSMHLDLYCDNTAVVGALNKFYSPSMDLNAVIVEIHKLCLDRTLYLTVHYVPSALNLADKPSRPTEYPEYEC